MVGQARHWVSGRYVTGVMLSLRFTLIELLTTISVIAVMASMLLPALSRSRDMARQTVCINNLHQISIAANLYARTHDEMYPVRDRFLDDFTPFHKYMGMRDIFICPGNPRSVVKIESDAQLIGGTDYLYWSAFKIADIEKNDKKNNGHGNNDWPYHFDPSNPKFARIFADKIKQPVVYDRCGPAHFGAIDIVYLAEGRVVTQFDMCDLWVLDANGRLVLDSTTPFPGSN
ncbi:hypothetical protein SDC9_142493 [bioreactor metagenome]|uniref:Type II secretion system protein G n=1 Tax=bioreactor metagenome TaxID=1076179 RepID=A0A645E1B3_9ZZZZ